MPKLRLLETRNFENISQALRNYNQNFPATPPAVLHYSKVKRNEETSVPDAYLLRGLQR